MIQHYFKTAIIFYRLKLREFLFMMLPKVIEKNFMDERYNDISFDVIKRGPLLVLLIGLTFAFLTFIFEFYFGKNKTVKSIINKTKKYT